MKKAFLALLVLMLMGSNAFAMGGIGGSRAGTCDAKSWSCYAGRACWVVGKGIDADCARIYIKDCMTSGTPVCEDYENYFPQYFGE